MIMIDITNNFENCLTLLLSIFTNLFNKLDNIQIWGTTLLNIYINIVIIMALIPVILTLANTNRIAAEKSERRKTINERRANKKSSRHN